MASRVKAAPKPKPRPGYSGESRATSSALLAVGFRRRRATKGRVHPALKDVSRPVYVKGSISVCTDIPDVPWITIMSMRGDTAMWYVDLPVEVGVDNLLGFLGVLGGVGEVDEDRLPLDLAYLASVGFEKQQDGSRRLGPVSVFATETKDPDPDAVVVSEGWLWYVYDEDDEPHILPLKPRNRIDLRYLLGR